MRCKICDEELACPCGKGDADIQEEYEADKNKVMYWCDSAVLEGASLAAVFHLHPTMRDLAKALTDETGSVEIPDDFTLLSNENELNK
jgi:hypothetical protein